MIFITPPPPPPIPNPCLAGERPVWMVLFLLAQVAMLQPPYKYDTRWEVRQRVPLNGWIDRVPLEGVPLDGVPLEGVPLNGVLFRGV